MYHYYQYEVHHAHETPTVFDRPSRAVANTMLYIIAKTTSFFSVLGSLSAKTSYVRTMHLWLIASVV